MEKEHSPRHTAGEAKSILTRSSPRNQQRRALSSRLRNPIKSHAADDPSRRPDGSGIESTTKLSIDVTIPDPDLSLTPTCPAPMMALSLWMNSTELPTCRLVAGSHTELTNF